MIDVCPTVKTNYSNSGRSPVNTRLFSLFLFRGMPL